MRKIRLVAVPLVLMCVAGLSGCVARYRVPSDAPYASVRLMTTTDDNTTFSVVDPAACPTPPRSLVLAGMGKHLAAMGRDTQLAMAGSSPEPASRTRERKVGIGKRLYVAVTSTAAPPAEELRCAAGVSFIPQAGGQYEIRYTRNESASQCSARVLRLQPQPDGGAAVVQEPSQQGFRALRKEYVCEAL
ncbi:hypothetical protein SAMN05216345_103536 [Cupriavidus sp. YR651]|uniref:hypothetical protein n=1 Tax=Cupriavidus sp. YR651 TaxID=1855315 RepID=UPI000888C6E0|nr:hypothetical protein [Cupriavidus sp. YR651]SDC74571.1 hypothetical protein SAMN05216345_103536 [Cupriavidus sp. YR651]